MSLGHMIRSAVTATLLSVGATGLFGCGEDNKEPIENLAPGVVRITGTVTELDDDTPVDGGVTIVVADRKRGSVTLSFGSLFTHPPPTPDRQELYQDIQKVGVGDVVTATATTEAEGTLRLQSIQVVTDR